MQIVSWDTSVCSIQMTEVRHYVFLTHSDIHTLCRSLSSLQKVMGVPFMLRLYPECAKSEIFPTYNHDQVQAEWSIHWKTYRRGLSKLVMTVQSGSHISWPLGPYQRPQSHMTKPLEAVAKNEWLNKTECVISALCQFIDMPLINGVDSLSTAKAA